MTDIIDEIDALVDEQLSGYHDRSGYDYNVNQDRCHHCEREWHGLKITARIESMAAHVAYDEDYRYADDDSEVLCPGSSFIGPWATKRQIESIRSSESTPYTLDSLMQMRAGIYGDGPSSEALRRAALDHSFPQRVILGVGDRVAFESSNGFRQTSVVTDVVPNPTPARHRSAHYLGRARRRRCGPSTPADSAGLERIHEGGTDDRSQVDYWSLSAVLERLLPSSCRHVWRCAVWPEKLRHLRSRAIHR